MLAFTNSITKEKIAENTKKEQDAAKKDVLAEASIFEDINYTDAVVKAVFCGKSENGETVGFCVNVTPNGYGGAIDMMVGITADRKLSGINVVSNSETAGLGARCKDSEFSTQFTGKNMPLSVIKNGTPKDDEIASITGATITSKAVVSGVNAAFDAINKLGGAVNE